MADVPSQGRFPKLRRVDEAAGAGARFVYFDEAGNEQLTATPLAGSLQWVPLSNGDPDNPSLIFANGQVVLVAIEV